MLSKNEALFLAVGLAIGIVLFLFQSVCQDDTTGNLTAVPWFWPCPNGSSATKSASTN
jgi:hypothetical protein